MNDNEFWVKEFGDKTSATDFAGRRVDRDKYGDKGSLYGWDIDHIQPRSKGGSYTDDNKQITNIATNREKGDNTPHFTCNGTKYQLYKTREVDKKLFANGYNYTNKKYYIVKSKE